MIYKGTQERPAEAEHIEQTEVLSDPVQIEPSEINDLFQLVFQSNADAILVSDSQSRIVLLNRNAEQFFNLSPEKILGRKLRLQNQITESSEVNISRQGKGTGIAEVRSSEIKAGNNNYRVSVFHDITELVRVREELRALSLMDDLVNLCNGRGFFTLGQQQVKISNRTGRGFYLFLTNIDNYKKVAGKHGQQVGNRLIIRAAKIIRDTFRTSDIVARISEEKFAILAVEAEPESLDGMAKRLHGSLETYNATAGTDQEIMASMGTAHYNPAHPCSIDELMAFADMLLYGQKRGQQKSALLWYLDQENRPRMAPEQVA